MELLHYDSQWFFSDAGKTQFSGLQTLEDRCAFIYSYLRTVASPELDKARLLIRVAFFLADGVWGSSLPYAAYPDVIDPGKNPFVAYLTKATVCPDLQGLYCVFLAILHETADPKKKDEWIYSAKVPEELVRAYCGSETALADPGVFEIEEALQLVQLKLIWLLGSEEARR